MPLIYIASIRFEPSHLLIPLQARITRVFHLETKTVPLEAGPSAAFDAAREQYNSSRLLTELVAFRPADAFRIIGVTTLDLFIPILTFVFGEAQLHGPAAIVSTHRLRNEYYGLARNETLLQDRLEKEAIHELGHTFGLVHCRNDRCVMNTSTYVENIDLKPVDLCYSCLKFLHKNPPKTAS